MVSRVLVTGASSGLGAHFARLLARNGASVVIAARRKDRLAALTVELHALGAAAVAAVEMDVADESSVHAAFKEIDATGPALDVVINKAGISGDGLATDLPTGDFDAVMGTILRGVWLVATEAARRWKAQTRGGAIVNIASIQAERVAPGLAAGPGRGLAAAGDFCVVVDDWVGDCAGRRAPGVTAVVKPGT